MSTRWPFFTDDYIPTGQYRARSAYRTYLTGRLDAPIAFLWNIEKRSPS